MVTIDLHLNEIPTINEKDRAMKRDYRQMNLTSDQHLSIPLSTRSISTVIGSPARLAMAAICIGIILLVGHWTGYAQQTSATLVGTLTDANGAVVTNAQIKVTNLATGSAREAVSDGTGNYSFSFLPAGDYELNITAAEYKTKEGGRTTVQECK